MTRPDLAAIEARAHAATPGPWEVRGDDEVVAPREDGWLLVAEVHGPEFREVAAFIAHARVDIDTLTARVRELEAAAVEVRDILQAARLPSAAVRAVLDVLAEVLDTKESP